jgi:hypothetical protein
VPRQPAEVTSIVIRTRHVTLAAAIIATINIVSTSWLGKEHVEFHEDMVMSDLDVEPLHQALRRMEHAFQTLLTG